MLFVIDRNLLPNIRFTRHTMRTTLTLLISLLISVQCALGADQPPKVLGDGSDHPKDGFASSEALANWASTSSLGGGSIQSSKLDDRAVYVVTRSFTSGGVTTELSIYTDKTDGKGVCRVFFQPTRLVELRPRFTEDTITIEQYDRSSRKWVTCMTITKYFFQDDLDTFKR